jgi:hypothetical protein
MLATANSAGSRMSLDLAMPITLGLDSMSLERVT